MESVYNCARVVFYFCLHDRISTEVIPTGRSPRRDNGRWMGTKGFRVKVFDFASLPEVGFLFSFFLLFFGRTYLRLDKVTRPNNMIFSRAGLVRDFRRPVCDFDFARLIVKLGCASRDTLLAELWSQRCPLFPLPFSYFLSYGLCAVSSFGSVQFAELYKLDRITLDTSSARRHPVEGMVLTP